MKLVFNTRVVAILVCIISQALLIGCRKFVEIKAPVTSLTEENIFNSDLTAPTVLTGLYSSLADQASVSSDLGSISVYAGLSADELTLFSGVSDERLGAYYKNALVSNISQNYGTEIWSPAYKYIYICNVSIQKLTESTSLNKNVKQQLVGEAKFMRAFIYFYLVNFFGDVPLVLSPDYSVSSILSRSSKAAIYSQIVADLKDAQNLLSPQYFGNDAKTMTSERLRPNKWAATALLSRVYLYLNDWDKAQTEASSVINNSAIYDTASINNVFLKNSKEAIWQLQPVKTGRNTEDGWVFILPATGPNDNNPVYLSSQLQSIFEPNDKRNLIGNWVQSVTVSGVTYKFPFKYKSASLNAPITEYLMVLRLGEQFLIRAEARAHLNNISGSKNDLDIVRKRAGLSPTTANDQNSLLISVLHERQVELFTEWGHRWLDLKRTGTLDAVMGVVTPLKSGEQWNPYKSLFPILWNDINSNPNLTQNSGY